MKAKIIGLLAETPVHAGTGRNLGVVDLPVARESTTQYPVIFGSSLKGALRDKMTTLIPSVPSDSEDDKSSSQTLITKRFGKEDQAGDLLISDARLLLLPVRSLTSSFRWVTCPHLLERYMRDKRRCSSEPSSLPVLDVKKGKALCKRQETSTNLYLEERQFEVTGEPDEKLYELLRPLFLHAEVARNLSRRLVVLDDDDFAWFAQYSLSIQARNVLDEDKRSKNLWYEETLMPDTLVYSIIAGRTEDVVKDALSELFPVSHPYIQVGGNETVGQGWFAVKVCE